MWKSRIIYISIIAAAFIFSQSLYDSVSFLTLIVLLAFPFLTIFLAVISFPLIKARLFCSKKEVCRFENLDLRIVIRNRSPFVSSAFRIFCSLPDKNGKTNEKICFVVNSQCGKKCYFDYHCFFANRGVYSVSIDSIEYYDFLKLIKIKKKIGCELKIVSNPARIQLPMSVSSQRQNQENSNVLGTLLVSDGGDMVGVRDYVYGDNVKNIHWKLSSKNDNLVIKSFAEDIYDQAYIIVDLSSYYSDTYIAKSMSDCVIETAIATIRSYHKNSIRFSVLINISKSEIKSFRVVSESDLFEVESFISLLPRVTGCSVSDVLNGININNVSGAEVCVITSFGSGDVVKNVKKHFVDSNTKLNIINISLYDADSEAGVVTYTKDYIENQIKGLN